MKTLYTYVTPMGVIVWLTGKPERTGTPMVMSVDNTLCVGRYKQSKAFRFPLDNEQFCEELVNLCQ